MMTEEKRIEWLLELQEHPEQLTDVDAEWEKFAASHAEELEILDEGERLRERLRVGDGTSGMGDGTSGIYKPRLRAYLAPRKILGRAKRRSRAAASFIGVLLASGIAFAAIQVVRNISTPKPQQPTTEQTTDINPVAPLPADTVQADTIPVEPYIFNNVPLDSMLTAIATAHNMQVEFENEAARHLRFHFVWKREDSLSRVVEKLNTFEAVNIGMEDKTLVVK